MPPDAAPTSETPKRPKVKASARKAKKKKSKRKRVYDGPGRPSALNKKMIELFERYVRQGHPVSTVASKLGICPSTARTWLMVGETSAPRTLYRQFSDAIKVARAEAEMEALNAVLQADQWQAKAWYLQHINPNQWSDKLMVRVEHVQSYVKTIVELIDEYITDSETKAALCDGIRRRLDVKSHTEGT